MNWLDTSRSKEQHGAESFGFSFFLIYPSLGTGKTCTQKQQEAQTKKDPSKSLFSGSGKTQSCKIGNFQTIMAHSSLNTAEKAVVTPATFQQRPSGEARLPSLPAYNQMPY